MSKCCGTSGSGSGGRRRGRGSTEADAPWLLRTVQRWKWPLVLLSVILLVSVWFTWGPGRELNAQEETGAVPRLEFEETSYDFGHVPLNTYVEHSFVFRNTGDAPLVLAGQPQIEAVEGC